MDDTAQPTNDANDTKQHGQASAAPSANALLDTAKDRALHFFSHASNETLGACLVGLGAATYIVLGRVGLVLIGVVGGVALHANWDNISGGEDDTARKSLETNRRNETGIDVARRVLEWREKNPALDDEDAVPEQTDFSSFQPATSQALEAFTTAVIGDYVKWWYSPILPNDDKFPSSCRQILTKFIISLSSVLSRKRPADVFLDFVTNSSSIMIVFLNQLSQALSANPNSTPAEAVQTYLTLKPDCSLANILDRTQQQKKLALVATDILERHVGGTVYRCLPARIFLREILANVALEKTLQTCSRSEWINDWIIHVLEDGEPEIMNVIDHSIEGSGSGDKMVVTDDGIVIAEQESGADTIKSSSHSLAGLIAEVDARRIKDELLAGVVEDDTSDSTRGIQTPSSSQDEAGSGDMSSSATFEPGLRCDGAATPSPRPSISLERQSRPLDTFSLHRAVIAIYDDSDPNDKRFLRSKPTVDYLIQVEPKSSYFAGWMIARTYEDFESLHEVLRRIATISGVRFAETHANLPHWRDLTRPHLRDELERYLVDAIGHEGLAESEGMKRFLDKDLGMTNRPVPTGKQAFWPNAAAIESVGKGVFGAITNAPKGVARGGKAVLGGVSGVLGGTPSADGKRSISTTRSPLSKTNTVDGNTTDSARDSMESRGSFSSLQEAQLSGRRESTPGVRKIRQSSVPRMKLPPPPSSIPDDYTTPARRSTPATPRREDPMPLMSADGTSFFDVPTPSTSLPWSPPATITTPFHSSSTPPPKPPRPTVATGSAPSTPLSMCAAEHSATKTPPTRPKKSHSALTDPETQIIVELLFATITELYNLSSAWQIRLTLLNAAKSFLLRPGNPQLTSMRTLLQSSVLDAHTSDAGIAAHVHKLRENTLPTCEELKAWPAELSRAEKEERRVRARKLLVEKGMPAALTSVMGSVASGEALGKVFDCLQIEEVARGLVFGLLLQGVRAVVQ